MVFVLILVGVAVVVAASVGVVWLMREVLNPEGKSAEKKTARILSKFALLRGFKVLSGVKLKDGGQEIVVENILIGYFGVLLVRTLGARGEYYGDIGAENWSIVRKDKKSTLPNAAKQLQKQEAALRALFAKEKLYKIPVESVIYYTSKSSKSAFAITGTPSCELIKAGKLSAYLGRTKFDKDIGLDVKKITDAIQSNALS